MLRSWPDSASTSASASRGKTPEPFGGENGPRRGPDLRRAAPRRAAAPLRLPARARRRARELGRSEGRPARAGRAAPGRPRRGPPARVRDLRGRDPGGTVRRRHGRDLGSGHVRARRGEAGRRPHRPPRRRAARGASGRSFPAKLGGDPKNWLLSASATAGGRGTGRGGRRYAPMLATLAEELPTGRGWLFEVKWDGYRDDRVRARRRRRRCAAAATGPDRALRGRRARRFRGRVRTPNCVLDGEVCALDENGTRQLLGHAARRPRRSSTTSSTCSRSTGSRSSTSR